MDAAGFRSLYFDRLDWCGCGNPESVVFYLRDVLRAHAVRKAAWSLMPSADDYLTIAKDFYEAVGFGEDSPLGMSYLYTLDAAGLIEHGGTVMGAWLTDLGTATLAFLEGLPDEKSVDEVLHPDFAD